MMTDRELLESLARQLQAHLAPIEYTIREGQSLSAELRALPAGAIVRLDGTFIGSFEIPEGITVLGGTLVATNNAPALIPASRTTVRGVDVTATGAVSELVRYEQVEDVTLDRCTVRGHPTYGCKRGIRLNARRAAIRHTTITECKAVGQDAQAICGWQYTKDVTIEDCHLEGAAENVMFGGADAPSADAIPQDILIQRCVLTKPLGWRGSSWTVKNLFELKCAKRVTLRACVLSHLWQAAQVGYACVLKTVNQDGRAPWSEVSDVLIERNQIHDVSAAFTLHRDPAANGYVGVPMTRVTIRDNDVTISRAGYGGTGHFLLMHGVDDTVIEHNTIRTDGSVTLFFDGVPCQRLIVRGNIIPDHAYGIKGSGTGEGVATLAAFAPGHVFERNLIVSSQPSLYAPLANRIAPALPDDTTGYGVRP